MKDYDPKCMLTKSLDGKLQMKISIDANKFQTPQMYSPIVPSMDKNRYNNTSQRLRYLDGWLYLKEGLGFKKYWFVLKGDILAGAYLTTAYLFFFKNQITHVREHMKGTIKINSYSDTIELQKVEGSEAKPWQCEFTIKVNGERLFFKSVDNITRERWIYALIDLVGQRKPPSELPTLSNQIRSTKKCVDRRSSTPDVPSVGKQPYPFPRHDSCSSFSNVSTRTYNPYLNYKKKELTATVPWYYKHMTREQCCEAMKLKPIGSYLLRDHRADEESFVLSYKDQDKEVKHFLIKKCKDKDEYKFEDNKVINSSFQSPEYGVLFFMDKRHSLNPAPVLKSNQEYITPSTPVEEIQNRPLPETPDKKDKKTRYFFDTIPENKNVRPPLRRQKVLVYYEDADIAPALPKRTRNPVMKSKSHGYEATYQNAGGSEQRRKTMPDIHPCKDEEGYYMMNTPTSPATRIAPRTPSPSPWKPTLSKPTTSPLKTKLPPRQLTLPLSNLTHTPPLLPRTSTLSLWQTKLPTTPTTATTATPPLSPRTPSPSPWKPNLPKTPQTSPLSNTLEPPPLSPRTPSPSPWKPTLPIPPTTSIPSDPEYIEMDFCRLDENDNVYLTSTDEHEDSSYVTVNDSKKQSRPPPPLPPRIPRR